MLNPFSNPPFVFDANKMAALGERLHADYVRAEPFPHAVIDDFLPPRQAETVLKHFPRSNSPVWLDWRNRDVIHQPKKQGVGHARRLELATPTLLNMLQAFNSYPFLHFLEKLTGIGKLLPDPYFHGGGLHQILRGGKLAVHTDFNHLRDLDLYRRLNVLLFLNKDWRPAYQGDLELWEADLSRCASSIAPDFNRLVVFNTNKKSFHGHPRPMETPEGITRKSIALYYYTAVPAAGEAYDGRTDWQEVHSGG